MKPLEIKKDLYWVGALNPDLRIFDVIMETKYGTSYNSYLIKGQEKIALSETVKDRFFDGYLENLQSLINVEDLDYIIINHTEPDHSGALANLLKIAKKAKVIGSTAAIKFLKQIVNEPSFESIEIKGGETIDLGGRTLHFIAAPFLHWPDSIYTYLPEDQVLFTCDSFGCHYSSEKVFNDLIEKDFLDNNDLLDAYKYYFDMIMSPFKPYVLQAIEKIKDLPIQIICPGHGPVLRDNPWKYVELYKKWSLEGQVRSAQKRVTISFVSAYGYTTHLAEKIAEGIKNAGDFEVDLYNIIYSDVSEILEKILHSQGILFGSPTINRDALKPVWDLLSFLNPIVHGGKLAAAFGSYGWSGEAVGVLESRLQNLKLKVVPGLKINFKPSEEELEKAFQWGVSFGQALLKK